jgi:hypothetical protein
MNQENLNLEEFDAWATYVEKGLLNGHVDWNIDARARSNIRVARTMMRIIIYEAN